MKKLLNRYVTGRRRRETKRELYHFAINEIEIMQNGITRAISEGQGMCKRDCAVVRIIDAEHGFRRIRYHDLRHSCASLLLANGVSLKQIQDWLGHSDFSITANTYAHLDFASKQAAAGAMSWIGKTSLAGMPNK